MYKLLQQITSPNDVKNLTEQQLIELSKQVRIKLIDTVSQTGGHLASNLGVVELTIALHKVFNSPKDQIVFDVGHQCYTHKLLTGRYNDFSTLRTENGISGFCRPNESDHDIFYSGHSGTSVSSSLGLAQGKKINGDENYVISIIGDGSFTGGMVYEALNNGGRSNAKQIIILNDNKMSISENVGAFAKYLAVIRSKPKYYSLKSNTEKGLNRIPLIGKPMASEIHKVKTNLKNNLYSQSNFFEQLGYRYLGPIDGHNMDQLINALESAKAVNGPVLLHVNTKKGKGYEHAEKSPSLFHGISKFDINSGEPIPSGMSFSAAFGNHLCEKAKEDNSICAVTAAMGLGTGLEKFSKTYPKRFFDVGIAEEHAVTFAGGLAKNGLKPVFAVYSTFLQRCYDQIVHDVSLQELNVVFGVDRAGFVGEDGETHHGIMDVAFLNSIPRVKVFSPCCFEALRNTLDYAFNQNDVSCFVRYPRGSEKENTQKLTTHNLQYSSYGDSDCENLIVTYGRITSFAIDAVDELKEKGINFNLICINEIKDISKLVIDLIATYKNIYFFEEGLKQGGVAQILGANLLESGFVGSYKITAITDGFVEQASVASLLSKYNLDTQGMIKIISEDF
ncbi:MAG: 1-deoxy-D-xylulose-5-phosphate synthase [Clostridia bacterium]